MTDSAAGVALSQPDSSAKWMPEFSFNNVTKTFPRARGGGAMLAVQGVDLEIERGSFTCVIGPSGCGKSTLLNMAAGLMLPTLGEVFHRGEKIRRINTTVGYMTQQNNLVPWRTVSRNVSLPLEVQGVARDERRSRVAAILELVGLSGFADHYPSQLSGGMQKRAALARTLIYEPETLLMDEPFGALDAQLRLSLQSELLSIWERSRKTVIFITHDVDEALLLGDRVAVFSGAPGRVIHIEDLSFSRPRNLLHLRQTPQFNAQWEKLWQLLDEGKEPIR